MVRTAILGIDDASSILATPTYCGEFAERPIAPDLKSDNRSAVRQFESGTPRLYLKYNIRNRFV